MASYESVISYLTFSAITLDSPALWQRIHGYSKGTWEGDAIFCVVWSVWEGENEWACPLLPSLSKCMQKNVLQWLFPPNCLFSEALCVFSPIRRVTIPDVSPSCNSLWTYLSFPAGGNIHQFIRKRKKKKIKTCNNSKLALAKIVSAF